MLIEIINNILSCNGYDQIEIPIMLEGYQTFLYVPRDPGKEEYFVTIEALVQEEAANFFVYNEGAETIFEKIRNIAEVGRSFEKNSTLIMCCESNTIDRDLMLKIEEDHYNFKKNIVTYTKGEITAFSIITSDISEITNDVISDIINSDSGNDFTAFKEQIRNRNNHFSLALKVMMKLPFITYVPKQKNLMDLESDIESHLSEYQRPIYFDLLEMSPELRDDEFETVVMRSWGILS